MTQMIQHMIAAAVDHTSFKDGVIEPGVANDFFCRPLRLMVGRSAACTGKQETHKDDLLHPCCLRGDDNVPRCFHVHSFIRLLSNLTIDARAMSNGVTTRECLA